MSLRTFFAKVVSDANLATAWNGGGTERRDMINDDVDLTTREKNLLHVGNEFLISMRIMLYEEPGSAGGGPGKEGGPGPNPNP